MSKVKREDMIAPMEYARLGKTGLKVSRICLGCMSYGVPERGAHAWSLDEEQGRPFIRRALELGINFFDTANCLLRRHQRGDPRPGDPRLRQPRRGRDRDQGLHPMRPDPNGRGLSRKAIMTEIDASLRRLGTDYVDLYQIHRWDYDTPIEETLEALHDVVKAGKARYIGASSMFAWQFAKALYLADLHGWTRFVSMQNHYNLLYREEEREMIPLCIDQGIGVIPWSPLARGRLARPWDEKASTERAGTDEFGKTLYARTEEADRAGRRPPRRGRRGAGPAPRAGRAGLAAGQARRHVADHRRHQAASPGRRRRRAVDQADPRGDRAARGAVRPPSRPRILLTIREPAILVIDDLKTRRGCDESGEEVQDL